MGAERVATELLSFLIADIRGYTSFTQERGDEAAGRLAAKFAQVAREGVEAHDGRLLELRGDEALAVFTSVRASLRAAVALQQVFADETTIEPGLPLNVGIGLDAGEVVPVEGGYRGGAINLAARLCSLAKAGEALASEGVTHLARAVEGVSATEWGTTDVKGLSEPVRAFALSATPSVPTIEFVSGARLSPALDTPVPMFGREQELRQLSWAWRAARRGSGAVVVVRGPPGIGKTRLLSAVAEVAVHAGGSVTYVSLASAASDLSGFGSALSADGPPQLLAVDDADDAVAALADLVQGSALIGRRPVMVVACLDDENAPAGTAQAMRRLQPSIDLRLPPLGPDAMRRLAELYLGPQVVDLPAGLLESTSGVPRRLHHTVAAWAEDRATRRLGQLASRAAGSRNEVASVESKLADSVAELQHVRERVRLYGLGPGRHDEVPDRSPYKGLDRFGPDDAETFFGRERLVADLVARVAGGGLVGVVGPSGSGKSSLVRAGLVPAVAAGTLPGSDAWTAVVMRPGEHPMRALDVALLPELAPSTRSRLTADRPLLAQLARDVHATPLLLVVDQAEELFTLCTDATERESFVTSVLDAASATFSARLRLVLTVRADYYGRFAADQELASGLAGNQVLVSPMSAEEYRRAITQPAERLGMTVEPTLVDALVDDVTGEPGGLPLLSTSLLELWERRSDRTMTLLSYRESGGLHAAVARLAESVYADLGDDDRLLIRRVFLRLTGPGIGDTVVKRQVRLTQLAVDGATSALVDLLARRRLLTVSDGAVEVAHEALLREWPRFADWLDEDREGIRLRAQLADAAASWESGGRDEGELYRGARLSAALDWTTANVSELSPVEQEFVTASTSEAQRVTAHQRRQNRRLRGLLGGVAALLVLALIAGAVALAQRHQAVQQRHQAENDASRALAQSLGTEAVNTKRIDEAMLLARQAVDLDPGSRTRGTLLATLLRTPALVSSFQDPITLRPRSIQLSPDGRTLAIDDNDGQMRFYATDTHQAVAPAVPEWYLPSFWVGPHEFAVSAFDNGQAYWKLIDTSTRGADRGRFVPGPRFEQTLRDGTLWTTSAAIVLPDGTVSFAVDLRDPSGQVLRGVDVEQIDPRTGQATDLNIPGRQFQAAAATGRDHITVVTDTTIAVLGGSPLRLISSHPVHGLPPADGTGVISPDGRTMLVNPDTGGHPPTYNTFQTVDLTTGRLRPAVAQQGSDIQALSFTPDSARIIASGDDGRTVVWDAATLTRVESLDGNTDRVSGQSVSSDGTTLWTSSLDGGILEWDLGQGRRLGHTFDIGLSPLHDQMARAPAMAISPDGLQVVASDSRDSAVIASVRDGATLATLRQPGSAAHGVTPSTALVASVAWSSRGEVATGSVAGIALWDVTRPDAPSSTLATSGRAPVAVAFSPDGRRLAALLVTDVEFESPTRQASPDDVVVVFDVASGQRLETVPVTADPGRALTFAPDGRSLAVTDHDVLEILDVGSGRLLRSIADPSQGLTALSWPTSNRLLAGGWDGVVDQWEPSTGKRIGRPVLVEPSPVGSISVDQGSGQFAVSGGSSGGAALWGLATGTQIGSTFPGGQSAWGNAQFADGGRLLVVVYDDGTAYSWPTDPSVWAQHACTVAGRNFTQEEWRRFVPGEDYQRTCPSYPAGR